VRLKQGELAFSLIKVVLSTSHVASKQFLPSLISNKSKSLCQWLLLFCSLADISLNCSNRILQAIV